VSTILIGVDASERSEDAIAFGSQLAQACGAYVVVANSYREPSRDQSLELVRALRERLDLPERRSRVKIRASVSPAHALHSLAETEDAALVIVGSTHTGRVGRVFPGSTGERLLNGAPCAVAVVPKGHRARVEPIGVVGVAYDGSAEARAAVLAAAELARGLDAELVLIGVVVPGEYDLDGAVDGQLVVRDVREELAAMVAELPGSTATLLTGDAAELLAEHSRHVDLLVTGSRGYGPLHRALLGSVSEELLDRATHPVLVVSRRPVPAPSASVAAAAAHAR
jgi:nucleotide-binding universal stress UspA family protein